jgi:tetratricopeptide (TPR) repeat protein
VTDHLRRHWDFDDLDATERRFRELLIREEDDASRAEVLTQLARVHGLRGDFVGGEKLIREAEALATASDRAAVRIDLERGRILRSSGDAQAALSLFVSSYERGSGSGELYLAADAAHMAALAAPDRSGMLEWTERGIELGSSGDGSASYWLGPLLNNLGWEHYEAGEHAEALEAFERALAARERDPKNQEAIALARYAVAKALTALGRPGEAAPLLEVAVAWTQDEGKPDGWYHEELAEVYAALGRKSDARAHARLALPLLLEADPSFEADAPRVARLRELTAEPN